VQLLDEPKGGLGLGVGALTERKHGDERDASIDSRVTGPNDNNSTFFLFFANRPLGDF